MVFKPTGFCIISRTFDIIMWKYVSSLIASLRKKLCYLHLIYVRVPVLSVQIVMFDPVSHKQKGPEARHDHPSCISYNKRRRVTARDRPKNATTMIVTTAATIPTAALKYVGAENP